MKAYIFSLGAGLLVGIVYSLLGFRSPAPPVIALVGLAGILAGERVVPVAGSLLRGKPFTPAQQSAAALPPKPEQEQ
ncbi:MULTISPECIES: DUF1427 family protein [Sphingobium]|uniref:DUF1427 family protein n=1 Tax=Sphingobium fuliginis (strain ATCC 27551) TaxID=336203 RepID=A0ABQ1F290_SPHSA|nr:MULTISPECIES: DUF1427 family protein [Sphingobium]MCB4860504.1 XapX domain-containing protein [Sphingobium sp. PNB]RYL96809.1 DUF1427 family protein [Sphingobium fuliginis]WDA35962.1 DUF1427 family protein [Sphingobium sp. YC-XJ3]GFZ97768.1 hypothetical protein GCM10019071_30130 [Sphingobium fuliginis]